MSLKLSHHSINLAKFYSLEKKNSSKILILLSKFCLRTIKSFDKTINLTLDLKILRTVISIYYRTF